MAKGAKAGIDFLLKNAEENEIPVNLCDKQEMEELLCWLWNDRTSQYHDKIVKYIQGTSLVDDNLTIG